MLSIHYMSVIYYYLLLIYLVSGAQFTGHGEASNGSRSERYNTTPVHELTPLHASNQLTCLCESDPTSYLTRGSLTRVAGILGVLPSRIKAQAKVRGGEGDVDLRHILAHHPP